MISKISGKVSNVGYGYNKIEPKKPHNSEPEKNLNKTNTLQGINIDMYSSNVCVKSVSFKGLTAAGAELIERARNFAKEKHRGQPYGFGSVKHPYTYHTEGVAKLVSMYTDDPEVIAAAHLHDTIEDTDTTYEELCLNFGKKVAGYVLAVTTDNTEKARLGKAKALVNEVISIDENSLLIKLCDRQFNVENLNGDKEFRRRYALETQYIIGRLLEERHNIPVQCRRVILNILCTLENTKF